MIKTKKRMKINKANWEVFKETLKQNMTATDINSEEGNDKEYIDKKLEEWYKIVKEAMDSAIPQRDTTFLPHPKQTEKQKRLQFRFKATQRMVEIAGMDHTTKKSLSNHPKRT